MGFPETKSQDNSQIVVLCIGEYSATKIYFFPGGQKNCEKVSPYFSHSGVEKFPNLHFFGKNFSRLALFWEKFAIFGGKIAKICIF